MIAPDALLKFQAAKLRRGGAAVQAVEPAVRAPGQVIRHGLGVFHAEAAQQHLGVAIGNIIAVPIGIKKQIGRLHYEYAAVAEGEARAEIGAADEVFELVGAVVADGVLHGGVEYGTYLVTTVS